MTKRDEDVLIFIKEYMKQNGYAPSIREIADGVGMSSSSSAYTHLQHLEIEGLIETKEYTPRAIKVVGCDFVEREVT